jgi:ClpP class serine protease
MLDRAYDDFTVKVAAGRSLLLDQVQNIARAVSAPVPTR